MINMKHTPTTTTTTTQEIKLSPRQAEALALYKQKTPVKEIAAKLGVKTVTVYGLLKQANAKAGLVGRLGHTRKKSTWKKYKPGKSVIEKPARPAVPSGVQGFLDSLPDSHKASKHKAKGKAIYIACSVHGYESNSALYSQAVQVDAALVALAALAKEQGKVFIRREFVLAAVIKALKEVRS